MILFDVTRTLSRRGAAAPTGIDRVERAWFDWASRKPGALCIARFGDSVALLEPDAVERIMSDRGGPDLRASITPWRDRFRRLLEASVRRHCRWYGSMRGLCGPAGTGSFTHFTYINVGHSALGPDYLATLRAIGAERIVVMVHDMFPIDRPGETRPDVTRRFGIAMRAVSAFADLVIYVSDYSRGQAERHFAHWGRVPEGVVAHPGVDVPALPPRRPVAKRFLMVGTVEPRKNHAFLLDLWPELAPDGHRLHVVGRPGWADGSVFDALANTEGVTYHGALDDADLGYQMSRAVALLFPSHDEGAGLPVGEALAVGLPVLAADLPSLGEIYPKGPVFLPGNDAGAWISAIRRFSAETPGQDFAPALPRWDHHFKGLERLVD
ncbi:MAG: glycosyltransferase family 4 protein [Rubricella sp.]